MLIALEDMPAGASVEGLDAPLVAPVSKGHKIAARPVASGERIIRYDQTMGISKQPVAVGAHVRSHNLGMHWGDGDYVVSTNARELPEPETAARFRGYRRADGRAGTRNYLGVLTLINCSGSAGRFIAEATEKEPWFEAFEHVDGIVPIVHGSGCGMSGAHEGYETLYRTLKRYARRPEFRGHSSGWSGLPGHADSGIDWAGAVAGRRKLSIHDDPANRRHPKYGRKGGAAS